ncbi:MAG: low molecular weight phosphotyrosine protein phosphatase, partial [Flavobacterium sp.]|nr:low molecular weight phosphotyrosine protein phosphatase [Flavobacterium sp.]
SILTAKNHRIDISKQRARQFKLADFQNFDYIFAMDNSNYKDIIRLAPDETSKNKVRLILNELYPGENIPVPDPYYGEQNGFEQGYNLLDEACDIIANKLKTQHL